MDRFEIQYHLRRNGFTQKEIARELDVSEPIVSQVISGDRSNRRIQETIARRIGKKRTEVFPEKPCPRCGALPDTQCVKAV